MGGPGFEVFEPNDNYVRVYLPKERWTPAEWRRMVYWKRPRKEQDAVFGVFDCPDGTLPAPRRDSSTNALQALNLLNSSFVVEQAGFLAERVAREAPAAPAGARVRRAFLLTVGREPDPAELAPSLKLAEEHGLPALARALLNSSELLTLE